MKKTFVLTALVVLLLTSSAWASLRFAVVVEGALGDQSFNDSAAVGTSAAEKIAGNRIPILECYNTASNYLPYITTASRTADVIITVGSGTKDALEQVAAENPKKRFVVLDTVAEGNNVTSVTFRQNEGSFLAGALAALMTAKEKPAGARTVGIVMGMDIPLMQDFRVGYEQGTTTVDPNVKVLTAFVGNWNDPALGKEIAISQFNAGASVIFQAAGNSGTGVIAAAKERHFHAIGVDSPQEHLAPGVVLTSVLKRIDTAIMVVVSDAIKGTLKSGRRSLGIAEGGVGLSWTDESKRAIPADVQTELRTLTKDILDGKISVKSQF